MVRIFYKMRGLQEALACNYVRRERIKAKLNDQSIKRQ